MVIYTFNYLTEMGKSLKSFFVDFFYYGNQVSSVISSNLNRNYRERG